jgi:hypothetical protein
VAWIGVSIPKLRFELADVPTCTPDRKTRPELSTVLEFAWPRILSPTLIGVFDELCGSVRLNICIGGAALPGKTLSSVALRFLAINHAPAWAEDLLQSDLVYLILMTRQQLLTKSAVCALLRCERLNLEHRRYLMELQSFEIYDCGY